MSAHHSLTLFSKQLFLLGMVCHVGSYFLPVQHEFLEITWGEIFFEEIIIGAFDLSTWKKHGFVFISLYLPPLMLLFSIGYFLRKRKILPTTVLIVGMLLPNLVFPLYQHYQRSLGQEVVIIWGYYAWALSYGLFFWSFHQYKYRRVTPRDELSDHLIED